jgi:hypothetical protein
MRIVNFETRGVHGIAADEGSGWHGLSQSDSGFPGTLPELIAQGANLFRIGRTLACEFLISWQPATAKFTH